MITSSRLLPWKGLTCGRRAPWLNIPTTRHPGGITIPAFTIPDPITAIAEPGTYIEIPALAAPEFLVKIEAEAVKE